jgi:hypothetical protein
VPSATGPAKLVVRNGPPRAPLPPSASLATDHSGRAGALRTARARSGRKWMCPRRQRFTRSGPADLGRADRDGRGCVAANGECAGRSLRAGRRAVLDGSSHSGALSLAPGRALAKARARARRWFCRSLSSENRDAETSRCRARERLRNQARFQCQVRTLPLM